VNGPKRNLDEGVGSPHVWVEESSIEETQNTRFWEEGCIEAQEGGHDKHLESSFDLDCSLFL